MFEIVWFEFEFDHVVGGKFNLSITKDFEVYHFVFNLIIFV